MSDTIKIFDEEDSPPSNPEGGEIPFETEEKEESPADQPAALETPKKYSKERGAIMEWALTSVNNGIGAAQGQGMASKAEFGFGNITTSIISAIAEGLSSLLTVSTPGIDNICCCCSSSRNLSRISIISACPLGLRRPTCM